MRAREGSALYVMRQRLITELLEGLRNAPFVFLLMEEADELWADQHSFQHWLKDSGLKICSTVIPSGSDHGLYKISKNLPLAAVLRGTNWGTHWVSLKSMESPKPPPSPTW